MLHLDRRGFIRLTGALAVAATSPGYAGSSPAATRRVVVIGAGAGGATAARYIAKADTAIAVTLIEADSCHYTCFMSNEVIGGERSIKTIRFGYQGLHRDGVTLVRDRAAAVDPQAHRVKTAGGETFAYDRLVVSPGIDFRWGAIEGYDQAASRIMPHAWKAGDQSLLLRGQLRAMTDGGLVVIAVPANPFRCPPGPYERACQIAHYLKYHKPKSKILILDANDRFSKQALFQQGWQARYKGMIDWVPRSESGNGVIAVKPAEMRVLTDFGSHQAAVANIIPPQQAGHIAHTAGLTDASGWCPVRLDTFESTQQPDIHVIGDASLATGMPKSGFAANSQAKVAAAAVVALLNGDAPGTPSFVNTCYSLVAPDYGISVAAVYRLAEDRQSIESTSGGKTPLDASAATLAREARYAHSWFNNMTRDMYG